MKKYLIIFFFLISLSGIAQESINDYKYAIIPVRYSFMSKDNMYRLNTLTKVYLVKLGYTVFYESDVLPDDIADSRCDKVYVDVEKMKSLLTTKLKLVFKDCKNTLLFESKVGTSSKKDFESGYAEALEEAFKDVKYTYSGKVLTDNQHGKITVKNTAVEQIDDSTPNVAFKEGEQLYAQPTAEGFQFVNSEPKIVMKIIKTSVPNYYIASRGTLQGVLVVKENQYYFEYQQNGKLVSEKINVKF